MITQRAHIKMVIKQLVDLWSKGELIDEKFFEEFEIFAQYYHTTGENEKFVGIERITYREIPEGDE